jgi:WD40 repeat protein
MKLTSEADAPASMSADNRRLAVWARGEPDALGLEVIDTESGKSIVRFLEVNHVWSGDLVSFSRDGRLAAFGSSDFAIKVWDLDAGRALHSLTGHVWRIYAVAFSADDRLLASASWDGDVRIWDVRTGSLMGTPLRGHGSGVRAVTFSPDGKTLVTAGDDNTVRFWHVATGREMLVLEQANTAGSSLLSPNGELLVVWDATRTAIRVERIPTLTEIAAGEVGHETERSGQ